MNTQLDLLFAGFGKGYLDTAASRTAGVPAASACALQVMDSEDEEADPRIVVHAEDAAEGRRHKITVTAEACGQAGRAVTGPWLAAVKARFADRASFFAHLAANLTEAQRAGWQITHMGPPADVKVQRTEGGDVTAGVAVIFDVMTDL